MFSKRYLAAVARMDEIEKCKQEMNQEQEDYIVKVQVEKKLEQNKQQIKPFIPPLHKTKASQIFKEYLDIGNENATT